MLRYNAIPSKYQPAELVDYAPNRELDDTRIVDDSDYIPNKAAEQILVKQKAAQMLSALTHLFDHPDDIASGAVNLLARHKGIDIAEVSHHAEKLKSLIDKQVKMSQRQQRRQQQQQNSLTAKEEPQE